jgi:uncharacterized membrane protein
MKLVRLHYGLSWISCILVACIIGGEVVKSRMHPDSFDLGYVEYLIPAIFILALIALYYSLFTWNKKIITGHSSELFWVILLLGIAIGIIAVMYVLDTWEEVFPEKTASTYFSDVLEGFLSSRSKNIQTMEKILFFLYAGYSLVLLSVLALTIGIRKKQPQAVTDS